MIQTPTTPNYTITKEYDSGYGHIRVYSSGNFQIMREGGKIKASG